MKKTKPAKPMALFLISIAICLALNGQTVISPMFRVANFWMPGNGNGLNLSQNFNGDLQFYIGQMKTLGVTHFRIGGKSIDQGNMFNFNDLADAINWLRSHGFEVIVQVPIQPTMTIAQNATRTASYVEEMNIDRNLHVELWAIGNEPVSYSGTYSTSATIAAYTRQCSEAMKAVSGQQWIKIIGPSLHEYSNSTFQDFLNTNSTNYIGGLSSAGLTHVDFLSFNHYSYSKSAYTNTSSPVDRDDVILELRAHDPNFNFAHNIQQLKNHAGTNAVKTSRNQAPLGIMVTEANIAWQQDNSNSTTKAPSGLGPGSFIGGQFWAEMMSIGMEKGLSSLMHWSTIEGTSSDSYLTDIGLICKETTTNTASPRLRPSYYHFEAMANRFKGNFYPATITGGNGTIKAWAAKDAEKVVVMIQNQNHTGQSYTAVPFQVRLSPTIAAASSFTVDILVDIFPNSPNAKYESTSTPTTLIANESTVLLTFNCVGNYGWRHDYTIDHANTVPDSGFQLTDMKSPSPMIAGQVTFSSSQGPGQVIYTYTLDAQLISSNSYTYTWLGPYSPTVQVPTANAGSNATLTIFTLTTSPTVYTYTAKDADGCEMTEKISLQFLGSTVGGGGPAQPPVFV